MGWDLDNKNCFLFEKTEKLVSIIEGSTEKLYLLLATIAHHLDLATMDSQIRNCYLQSSRPKNQWRWFTRLSAGLIRLVIRRICGGSQLWATMYFVVIIIWFARTRNKVNFFDCRDYLLRLWTQPLLLLPRTFEMSPLRS